MRNMGFWGEMLAVRWSNNTGIETCNPESRGLATRFIVTEELEQTVCNAIASIPEVWRRS